MHNFAKSFLSTAALLALLAVPALRAEDPPATTPGTPVPAASDTATPVHKGGAKRLQAMEQKRLADIDAAVTLTDDQKTQIKAIWAKSAADLKDASPADRRTAMKTTHDEVRALLTPDQQVKFDAMPAEGRGAKKKAAQ